MDKLNSIALVLAFAVGALLSSAVCWLVWGGEGQPQKVPAATAEVRTDKGLVAGRQPAIWAAPLATPAKGGRPQDTGRIKAVAKAPKGSAQPVPANCPEIAINYTVSEDKDGNHLLTFESDNASLEATHYQIDFSNPEKRRPNRLMVTTSYDPDKGKWNTGGLYTRDLGRWPVFVGGGVVDKAATATLGLHW